VQSATIAIAPYPETGHLNATLAIGKRLVRRGHRVVYVGPADARAPLEREGFPFVTLYESVLPEGWFDAHRARLRSMRAIALQRGHLVWQQRSNRALAEGREDGVIRSLGADLVLCDADQLGLRLRLASLGVPFMTVHCTLARDPERELPQPFFPLMFQTIPKTLPSRIKWRVRLAAHREIVSPAYARIVYGRPCGAPCPAWGAMRRAFIASEGSIHPFAAAHPKLVLSGRAFDLPRLRPDSPTVCYAGPRVDLDRQEPPLDLADDARPLVFCSLGSQTYRLRARHVRFFELLVDVFRARADLRLLIATGQDFDPREIGEVPPNVTVRGFVPQLRAIRAASLVITHGGLNTVKECLVIGRPMIVFPQQFDQPGNAMRVAHHGLGACASIGALDKARLAELIDQGLTNAQTHANVARMRALCESDEARDDAEAFIERYARRARLSEASRCAP
jgi:UDP:flavonoid glycosyltransferase YjiC (YdhE family)